MKNSDPSDYQISLRLPTEIYNELYDIAVEDDRSVSYIIRLAIKDFITSREER